MPNSNSECQFQAGALCLQSISYEWLVIARNKAQLTGEGTLNSEERYYG